MDLNEEVLQEKRHIKYFQRILGILPGKYGSHDTNRVTFTFFAIGGLELLHSLSLLDVARPGQSPSKQEIIDWIYACQIIPQSNSPATSHCGFRGTTANGQPFTQPQNVKMGLDSGHIANTYTALAVLAVLGDDFSRLNREAVLSGLTRLQLRNGSFMFSVDGSENDMRFLYCACCVSYMLKDFSHINTDRSVEYIRSSLTFEGGIAQGPGLEAHGGSTFCAVAALWLMGRLDDLTSTERDGIIHWCLLRQWSGFQGRPNKQVDTCYSFWVCATLDLLGSLQLIDETANRNYVLSTQDNLTGGFGKWTTTSPDPLHSYMGLAGLSLNGEPGLQKIHTALNISERAAKHIEAMIKV